MVCRALKRDKMAKLNSRVEPAQEFLEVYYWGENDMQTFQKENFARESLGLREW